MISSYWELSEAERAGFDRLFRRYAEAMVSFALTRLGSRARAEEAVQEAFCYLIRRAEEKNLNLCDIRPGLIVYIVKWKIIDLQRREGRERERVLPFEETQAEMGDGTENQVEQRDLRFRAAELLRRLPEEERELLLLRYAYGLTEQEIADLIGISRGAVAMRLKRLREKLRKQLEETEVGNGG